MKTIVLFDGKDGNIDVCIWAEMKEGSLVVAGHDIGEDLVKYFGTDEHEYFYYLDVLNTEKFFGIVPPDKLYETIGGLSACSKFTKICDENGIRYTMEVY